MKNDLELIGVKEFEYYEDMYLVVDFLNKNLSKKDLAFGLSEKNGKQLLTIYKEL